MASSGKIAISYVVNNSEFNSKMADMKRNLSLLQQEVKNSAKEVDYYGSNLENLGKKQSAINEAITQTKKIMQSYNEALEKNKKSLNSNQAELTRLATAKKEINAEYKKALKSYGEESEEVQRLKQSLEKVNAEYDKTKAKIESNKKNIVNYTTQIEKQRSTLIDLEHQLEKTNEAIKEQATGFAEASKNFAEVGQRLEDAGGKISDLGEEAQRAGALILGAVTVLGTMALETDTTLSTIRGRLGTTVEETERLKQSAKDLYNNGFGESLQECVDDVVLLQQNIKDTTNLTDEERLKLLEYIETMKSLFGVGADELTRTINNMIKNGVVNSVEEGMDVLTVGFQNGANSAGDLLDVFYEYSPQFKKLGLNGQDALEMIIGGLDAGAYNADKLADALKEVSIRAIDGSKTTKEGFETIGLNADEMAKKFAAGGETAKEALSETIDALAKMKDPIKQDLAGVSLFGTMWEDSSKQAILAMGNISNGLGDISGATKKAGEEINNSFETKLTTSIRQLKDSLLPLGEALLPAIDGIVDGIGEVTDVIKKISPETVKTAAKFGAMAIVFGTATKATGSLVTVLGKGCTGISALLKIAADTKSLGSFTKALGQSESAVGGLVKGLGGLVKGLGGLTLKGGVVGLAVAGVAALGTAFYMNQKEIEESEKRYDELGGKIGEFTGRLRSNENTWTEIFGKEYSWKFSEEYKTALDNAEGDVANWVETLKGYQDQIYAILNSTEINQQTKDEQVATLIKDIIGAGNIDDQVNSLTSGMSERGFSPEQINKTVEDFKKAMSGTYSEIEGLELKGLEMVKQYTTTTIDEMGNQVTNVDWDGFNKDFSEYLNENHNDIVTSQNENYDDLLEITQKYTDELEVQYGKATEGSLEYNKKTVDNTKKAKLEEIQSLRDSAKEHGQLTTEYNQSLKERERAIEQLAGVQNASLQRMALYDSDFAEQNNLTTKQLNDNAYMVTDSVSGISTAYFDNEEALKRYAEATMTDTATIVDEVGNMHTVMVDQFGNITGVVDNGASTFGFFANSASDACNKVIEQAGLTSGTAEEKFAAICAAIDDGTLSAEAFGMTDAEFKAAAGAMVNAGGDATTLKNKLNEIPKNVSSKVEVTGVDTATGKVEGLLTKLGNLGSKVWSAAVNVATSAGNFFGFENGGTVNESGVYNTQEAGLELIDTPSYTNAYSLGDVARGELTYIPANSKVTNAAMTSLKMESMIDSKLRSAMNMYMNDLNKNLINMFKSSDFNRDFKIIMNDPHFENKPSEQQNINNIKRIIAGMK